MGLTPPKRSNSSSGSEKNLSSGSEKTPDSETPRTKSTKSPSLQAFHSFDKSLARFLNHVQTKIDYIGSDDVDRMKALLVVLGNKCKRMEKQFEEFISHLDTAIRDYEAKKPNDLAADANSLISPEESARNRTSIYKGSQTIEELFAALNGDIFKIFAAIQKKIDTSMYEDYSSSLGKKLKNLKKMCEAKSKTLEETGKKIMDGIDQNEGIRRSNNISSNEQASNISES